MISNPIGPFSFDGSEEPFTYEGGKFLYHVSPHDSEIEGYEANMSFNLVFFANDEKHAKSIFESMLKYVIEKLSSKFSKNLDISNMYTNKLTRARNFHKNIDKFKFVLAPTNQFYKVGWAGNDEA